MTNDSSRQNSSKNFSYTAGSSRGGNNRPRGDRGGNARSGAAGGRAGGGRAGGGRPGSNRSGKPTGFRGAGKPKGSQGERSQGTRGGYKGPRTGDRLQDARNSQRGERPKGARDARDNQRNSRPQGARDNQRTDRPQQARQHFDKRHRSSRVTSAREIALSVLHQLRERDAFAQDLIDKAIDDSRLPREEKAFVTVLVLGVVSTRGTLDEILNACLDSPSDISPAVRDALQISTYEIIYLEKSPHAAVDQGVELVRSIAPKASGLANAVLRRVVRARDNFPFGDPRTDLTAYSRLHGFPQWLTERLLKELGPQDAHAFMKASNEPAPIFISINPAQATDAEVIEVLAQAHGNPRPVQVEGHAVQGCYRLESGVVLHDGRVRRLLNKGCLLVSDATSQAVAGCVVGATLPDSFLEIGAGRATKTILDQGVALRRFNKQIPTYVTVDNHAFKTKLLKQRAEQFGIEVSEALTGDARAIASLVEGRTFDTIFIDAPCSGLGTLRRHPEIRWRITPDTFNEMAALDEELLSACAPLVKSAGRVCYATCTITREENDQVILKFLQSEAGKGFVLVNPFNEEETFEVVGMDSLPEGSCLRVKLEPGGSDAHFLAILKRVSE